MRVQDRYTQLCGRVAHAGVFAPQGLSFVTVALCDDSLVLATIAIALAGSMAIALCWNRFFPRVPWRIVAILWVICAAYQAETLFTKRVDVRGVVAGVYPWKAAGFEEKPSNTGIVFTQLAPWTRNARDQLKAGKLPLWNRNSASGAPLLANQQTAIFHPFTLLGLPLSLGKAFTLTATLRLFTVLFFMFAFLRGFGIRDEAALFGAVAYAFSTFHIVWLLFPLGLATMMLPVALCGAQHVERRAGFVLLVIGLATAVLGGHPESALWVWIVTAGFIVYQRKRVPQASIAFIIAMLLTAFFWYPSLRALQSTERYRSFQAANPADHGLSYEWLLPLVTPNVLGYPNAGTYTPPRGAHPAVLNDYGEVASSYAGLITLALALAAPFVARRKSLGFAIGLLVFSFMTIAEVPLWRDGLHAIPLAGISLHQRLRVFWDLGICIAAALTAETLLERRRVVLVACAAVAAAFAMIYVFRRPSFLQEHPLAVLQCVVPLATIAVFAVRPGIRSATALVLLDLVVATWRYNPLSEPGEVFPVTGAIRFLQEAPRPARMVAWGWSLIPETPGYYGIEDVKATDPLQHFGYMFMLRGYLDVVPGSYDLVIRNIERPFADYLNVRYLYVPPDHDVHPAGFVERYRGPDGKVLENLEVLPRYFLARSATVESDLGTTIFLSRAITDFREETFVDRAPFETRQMRFAGGAARILKYEAARSVLDIDSRGLNLLVTSDANWAGWRAYWNGSRKDIVRVNGAFMGVFVPEGRGRLELRYWPEELVQGALAGIVGLILLAIVLAVMRSSTLTHESQLAQQQLEVLAAEP